MRLRARSSRWSRASAWILGTFLLMACASDGGRLRDELLLAAFNELNQAYRTADVDRLESLITADYVHTNGGSPPIGRDQWLDWNRLRAERQASGAWVTETYDVEEVQVRAYGDTALVAGVVRSQGVRDGAATRVAVRFTSFWVFRDGAWRRAAFQDAPLPAQEP
jgi:ketosteroid isomerase-like protein